MTGYCIKWPCILWRFVNCSGCIHSNCRAESLWDMSLKGYLRTRPGDLTIRFDCGDHRSFYKVKSFQNYVTKIRSRIASSVFSRQKRTRLSSELQLWIDLKFPPVPMKVYEGTSTFTYSSTVGEWWSGFTPPGLEILVRIWQGNGLSVSRRWHRENCLALPHPNHVSQANSSFPLCLSTVRRRHKESGGKAPRILSPVHCHALTPESIVFLIIGHITDWAPASPAVGCGVHVVIMLPVRVHTVSPRRLYWFTPRLSNENTVDVSLTDMLSSLRIESKFRDRCHESASYERNHSSLFAASHPFLATLSAPCATCRYQSQRSVLLIYTEIRKISHPEIRFSQRRCGR